MPRFVFEAHSTDYQPAAALRGSGRGRLRHPQGRPVAHFCAARGAVRRSIRSPPCSIPRSSEDGLVAAMEAADARASRRTGQAPTITARRRSSASSATSATATASATTGRIRRRARPSSGCSRGFERRDIPETLVSQYLGALLSHRRRGQACAHGPRSADCGGATRPGRVRRRMSLDGRSALTGRRRGRPSRRRHEPAAVSAISRPQSEGVQIASTN